MNNPQIYTHDSETLIVYKCNPTFPCKHQVTCGKESRAWYAWEIVRWFQERNLDIPKHFQYIQWSNVK